MIQFLAAAGRIAMSAAVRSGSAAAVAARAGGKAAAAGGARAASAARTGASSAGRFARSSSRTASRVAKSTGSRAARAMQTGGRYAKEGALFSTRSAAAGATKAATAARQGAQAIGSHAQAMRGASTKANESMNAIGRLSRMIGRIRGTHNETHNTTNTDNSTTTVNNEAGGAPGSGGLPGDSGVPMPDISGAIKSLGAASVTGAVGLVKGSRAALKFSKELSAAQEHLSKYNAVMAYSYAQLEFNRIGRNLAKGDMTSGSNKYLNEQLNSLESKMLIYQVAGTNVMNQIGGQILSVLVKGITLAEAIATSMPIVGGGIEKKIDELRGQQNNRNPMRGSATGQLFAVQSRQVRRAKPQKGP